MQINTATTTTNDEYTDLYIYCIHIYIYPTYARSPRNPAISTRRPLAPPLDARRSECGLHE
jgi:hypothetical protein